jgi:hypothetical protein
MNQITQNNIITVMEEIEINNPNMKNTQKDFTNHLKK